MDFNTFREAFWHEFQGAERNRPDDALLDPAATLGQDLCPDVPGMLSIRKQRLLNMAFAMLPEDEAYLEVGCYKGKSLISAMAGNEHRQVYAVDNFTEFDDHSFAILRENLCRYGLWDRINFHNGDFKEIYAYGFLDTPVGLCFYDGAHDLESQYLGLKLAEPFLADDALVLVDDWRSALDSRSFAREGSLKAMAESGNRWKLYCELPARYNGDLGLWWNGIGVLRFQREAAARVAV